MSVVALCSGSPLGRELVHTVMMLMFLPGFTTEAATFAIWLKQINDARQEAAREYLGE